MGNILSDYLGLLGVPYTDEYVADEMASMPFKTLFGLSKLLEKYGVDTRAYRVADKSQLSQLPVPFIAPTDSGLVIVTSVDDKSVSCLSQGAGESTPRDKWTEAWSGVAFCGFPHEDACEPDYAAHRRVKLLTRLRDKGIVAGVLLLFVYLFVSNHIYAHVSTILLTLFNLAGLYFTYLLVQKSLRIHSRAADEVCKVLQEGGCDSILETSASKLMGFSDGVKSGSPISPSVCSRCLFSRRVSPTWPSSTHAVSPTRCGAYGISISAPEPGAHCVSACNARSGVCFSAIWAADGLTASSRCASMRWCSE